jgi:iron complex outermembrane receptor protein
MNNIIQPVTVAGTLLIYAIHGVADSNSEHLSDQHHSDETVHEVVISASPLGELSSGVKKSTSLFTGEDLRTQAATSLGETLASERGVTNSGFGPAVGRPVIRGQADNRVKVMQDSLGSMDASNASADHAITIEPLLAERIEVLRGPATLRYGNGAIGGVVNVIDNRIPDALPQNLSGALEVRHNSVNDQNSAVFLFEGGAGKIAWHVDGFYRDSNDLDIDGLATELEPGEDPDEHETTDGYIDNTDFQAHSGTAGISWIGDNGFIGIAISQLENNYGIPPGAHEHHHEEDHDDDDDHDEDEHGDESVRIDMKQTRIDLKGEWNNLPFAGFDSGRFRLSHNDYEHIELESGSAGTRFENDAWESRVELIHQSINGWQGAAGVQLEIRDFAAIGDEAFIPVSDVTNQGVFWVLETEREQDSDPVYEVGVRLDRQNIDADGYSDISHNTISLSASGLWAFGDNQEVSLSLNRAQRAPAIEELLSDGAHLATGSFDQGDADLDEETSLNVEVGYHLHGPVELNLNLFYNQIDDFIYKANTGLEDMDEELPIFQYTQTDATFKGVEFEVTKALSDTWAFTVFSDYVRAKLDEGGDVPRIPPLQYGFALDFNSGEWRGQLRLTEAADQNHPGDSEESTDGYTRLDGSLHRHLHTGGQEWLIFLNVRNLLDEDIRNATSFLREVAPEAGRSLELGARLSF